MHWSLGARELGRPVKWTGDRSGSLVSDTHARDAETDSEMALDENGKILAIRVKADYGIDAYLPRRHRCRPASGHGVPERLGQREYSYPRGFQQYHRTGYRAGRPEAVYVVERLLDIAADEMGIDPVKSSRGLYHRGEDAFTTLIPTVYDPGDFPGITHHAADIADIPGFEARKAESAPAAARAGHVFVH